MSYSIPSWSNFCEAPFINFVDSANNNYFKCMLQLRFLIACIACLNDYAALYLVRFMLLQKLCKISGFFFLASAVNMHLSLLQVCVLLAKTHNAIINADWYRFT